MGLLGLSTLQRCKLGPRKSHPKPDELLETSGLPALFPSPGLYLAVRHWGFLLMGWYASPPQVSNYSCCYPLELEVSVLPGKRVSGRQGQRLAQRANREETLHVITTLLTAAKILLNCARGSRMAVCTGFHLTVLMELL